ncbi:hypothetical protein LXL04_019773 [Taraxacum kok-saghyz]
MAAPRSFFRRVSLPCLLLPFISGVQAVSGVPGRFRRSFAASLSDCFFLFVLPETRKFRRHVPCRIPSAPIDHKPSRSLSLSNFVFFYIVRLFYMVKRSLPFSDEDIEPQKVTEIPSSDERRGENVKLESGHEVDELKISETEIKSENDIPTNESDEGVGDEVIDENKNTNLELEYKKSEDKKSDDEVKIVITPETKVGSRKKRCAVMVENSIAGRLRSRRKCA